jgi:hypothetical protein
MADFSCAFDYQRFRDVVRSEYRYVRPANIEAFLQTVAATASKRVEKIETGAVLWRAQLGHDRHSQTLEALLGSVEVEVLAAYPLARMKPLVGREARLCRFDRELRSKAGLACGRLFERQR